MQTNECVRSILELKRDQRNIRNALAEVEQALLTDLVDLVPCGRPYWEYEPKGDE